MLAWYDQHHRDLPWRVSPKDREKGEIPDPYRVWLSEIMLQQTTVATVDSYFRKFIQAWPDVHALAAAPQEDVLALWAGLGYYARARNLFACANVVSRELGGKFPDNLDDLRRLPGIGPYTAGAIAAIAFDRPATVVDGNVERVMARVFAVEEPLPKAKRMLQEHAKALTPKERPGDYAQAVMDLGATVCTPKSPKCGSCPWSQGCLGREKGIAATLPRKAPKRDKPIREGYAWALFNGEGQVGTVRRPNKGLLGGMLALPSSNWGTRPDPRPPFAANWQEIGEIRHTFTHFHLRLMVMCANGDTDQAVFDDPERALARMPTVFAKALRLALSQQNSDFANGD